MNARQAITTASIALLIVGLTTACSVQPQDGARDLVRPYVEALAAGDGALAHDLNPYAPILTAEGLAASAAASEHLSVVHVGKFEEATDRLGTVNVPTIAPTASTDEGGGDKGLLGIDFSDDSWSGLETPKDALKDVKDVVTGFVPVTISLGASESTVPLGVACGRDDTGKSVCVFRRVDLTEEQQAKYGTDVAPPAFAPAEVMLETTAVETPEPSTRLERATAAVEAATGPSETTRDAIVAGVTVTLSDVEPLLLLPGSYTVAVPDDDAGALWAPPGLPEPTTVTLGQGETHSVVLAAPELTAAGRESVRTALELTAASKFEDITTFSVSDRERSCSALAPQGWSGTDNGFEDDDFSVANTNLASGAIEVTATSTNGATGVTLGNGSTKSWADEAFCAGLETPTSVAYAVPVEVLNSRLTTGTLKVNADGSFTTTTPWVFAMETTITTWGNRDAAGGWNFAGIQTTYTSVVSLEWSPSGVFTQDGQIKIEGK